MDQPPSHVPEPDHITAALEASCGALLALEVARQEMASSDRALELATSEVEHAITSVRRTIQLLYSSAGDGGAPQRDEMLALGFVLDERSR
jgi:hypothetical protein